MAEQKVRDKKIILSFQPFSIIGTGGGARILRRLVEGRESELIFFSFVYRISKNESRYNEEQYVLIPAHRRWMRSFLRNLAIFFRSTLLHGLNTRRIQSKVSKLDFDILHVLDHSLYSNVLIQAALKRNIPIWASFHDHFMSTGSFPHISKEVWIHASKRMVISHEMGQHYSELFGTREYIIVTDGLKPEEISPAKSEIHSGELSIYFGGLLHLDYYELFEKFCKTLEILSKEENMKISLILRGTQKLSFLNDSSLEIDYRPFSIDTELLRLEMNESDILYLPIKYTDKEFYLYSFSTKMIGYLGASGNIFYHGPKEAAAARFLEKNGCGLVCDSLDPEIIMKDIKALMANTTYSSRAKQVANESFQLKDMQERFFA